MHSGQSKGFSALTYKLLALQPLAADPHAWLPCHTHAHFKTHSPILCGANMHRAIVAVGALMGILASTLVSSLVMNTAHWKTTAAHVPAMQSVCKLFTRIVATLLPCMGPTHLLFLPPKLCTMGQIGMFAVSRIVAAVARQHLLPPVLARVHKRFGTPHIRWALASLR
jgi:hypothetical protein